jgi:hypothetical protein
MLNNQVFYHGIIRKCIVGFGTLFSDIYIDRKEGDSVTGATLQRLQIPLAYAPKEKWIVRLDQDPNLENHTYVSLPRMSFEITGYTYDAVRKTARMQRITCGDTSNSMSYMYAPVPYNIDISLYILTKTQEDAMQIVEQILPTFTPEYTLSINAIPDMNVTQDIPVILNSITVQDEYDGDFQTRRFVTHTLTFTLKTNLYGNVNTQGVIDQVTANIGLKEVGGTERVFVADGDSTTATVTNENWTFNF